jgi:membrane dipeptidase
MSNDTSNYEFGCYDFGLSSDQEARAARLHEESIVIDMLYWGPCTYLSYTDEMVAQLETLWQTTRDIGRTTVESNLLPQKMTVRGEFPEFKECWDASGVTAGNRTVDGFTSIGYLTTFFGTQIALFDSQPWVVKALTARDIRQAKAEGTHAAWLNTQLGAGVNADFINLLEPAYDLGLRMVMLTYNSMTMIGAGCTERTDAGISNYGAQVVRKLNELGIIVDISHCGRRTTLDACELSSAPVIASHTSAQGVYDHARGKSDEELRAIADSGGVIGVVTVPFFLGPGAAVGMDAMMDHIDYLVDLVGWEHVGIGSDWPVPMPKSLLRDVFSLVAAGLGFRDEDNIDTTTNLVGFDDYRDFPNITRGLVQRGYTDEQIKGILGENFLRVFEAVCGS